MASSTRQRRKADEILQEHRRGYGFPRRFQRRAAFPPTSPGVTTEDDMTRNTPAPNAAAYRDVWAMFWGNVTALQQIVIEDFPDGANELSLIHISEPTRPY